MSNFSMRRRAEQGGGKIAFLIALVLVAGLAYFLTQYIPPTVRHADYTQAVEDNLRDFTLDRVNYDDLMRKLIDEGRMREIKLTEDNINIQDGKSDVRVEVSYVTVIKLPWGTWDKTYTVDKTLPRF